LQDRSELQNFFESLSTFVWMAAMTLALVWWPLLTLRLLVFVALPWFCIACAIDHTRYRKAHIKQKSHRDLPRKRSVSSN
jgi:hypothetical protein